MNYYLLGMVLSDNDEKKALQVLDELQKWRQSFGQALADVTGNTVGVFFMAHRRECVDVSFFIALGDDVELATAIVQKMFKLHPCKYITILGDAETADHLAKDVTQVSLGFKPVQSYANEVIAAIDRLDTSGVNAVFNPATES